MNRRWFALVLILSPLGCASISDYRFRAATERRAKIAWRECRETVCKEDRTSDFIDGFQAGYVDVCRGGDGACPAVPPPCYWGARFQTEAGIERVNKWYSGFAKGAAEAMRCGCHLRNNVPSRACTNVVEQCPNQCPTPCVEQSMN